MHLKNRVYLTGIKKLVSTRAHCEPARGSDMQNKNYCSKTGFILLEMGDTQEHKKASGSRKLYQTAVEVGRRWASGETTLKELIEECPENERAWGLYKRTVDAARELYEQARLDDEVREEIGDPLVLEWQFLLLVNTLLKPPHPRKITWYVDERGGSGKTFICKWFEAYTNCVKFEKGRSGDIAHAYHEEKIVLFDLTRASEEIFNYEIVEKLKNGSMYSPKDESRSKRFLQTHVVVFSNWWPDRSQLSADRWDVKELRNIDVERFELGWSGKRVRVSSILRDADIKVKRPGVIILQKAPVDHHEASSSHVASDEEYKEAAMDDEEAAVQEVRTGLKFSAGPSVVVA